MQTTTLFMKGNRLFLISGSNGQLASEFKNILTEKGIKFVSLSKDELDITDCNKAEGTIQKIKPDVLINCAAYNFVDKAEEDSRSAFSVNGSGVENLALICKKQNIFMVHYSTDYVFDGKKLDFYGEDDIPQPLNVYGKSKLHGEEAIKKHLVNFLILRVSWVIGSGKQNFLYKLVQWAQQNRVLKISADEVSIPTFTEDIVKITLLSLDKQLRGLYHAASSGYCSRYELAKYFIKKIGLKNLIIPVPLSTLNIKTQRPLFSAISNGKISKDLNISIPDWEYGLERFITGFKRLC